jgi:hypothetical protein
VGFDVGGREAGKCASEVMRRARSMPHTADADVSTLATAGASGSASGTDLMFGFATANFLMRAEKCVRLLR